MYTEIRRSEWWLYSYIPLLTTKITLLRSSQFSRIQHLWLPYCQLCIGLCVQEWLLLSRVQYVIFESWAQTQWLWPVKWSVREPLYWEKLEEEYIVLHWKVWNWTDRSIQYNPSTWCFNFVPKQSSQKFAFKVADTMVSLHKQHQPYNIWYLRVCVCNDCWPHSYSCYIP